VKADRTGVVIPPPLLFIVPFAAGWLLDRRWPWTIVGNGGLRTFLAIMFVATGVAVAIAGVRQFRAAGTTVLPFGGTSRMVTTGIYGWTRNPMYLGMALSYVGCAMAVNSGWCLLFLSFAVGLVHALAIRREERYLAGRFGDTYERYRREVHRWI
jgi:protein-S-isoprenylcysteine O-methyltransferase Ste14